MIRYKVLFTLLMIIGFSAHVFASDSFSSKFDDENTNDMNFKGMRSVPRMPNEPLVEKVSEGTMTVIDDEKAVINVATANNPSAQSEAISSDVSVKSIALPSSLNMVLGSDTTLEPEILPTDAQTTLSWKSSNGKVVYVDSGKLYAVGPGTSEVTVTSSSNSLSAVCTVTVKESTDPNFPYLTGSMIVELNDGNKDAYHLIERPVICNTGDFKMRIVTPALSVDYDLSNVKKYYFEDVASSIGHLESDATTIQVRYLNADCIEIRGVGINRIGVFGINGIQYANCIESVGDGILVDLHSLENGLYLIKITNRQTIKILKR